MPAPATPDFTLRILGQVRVSLPGTSAPEPTARAAAALAYLGMAPGTRKHVSVLAGALWPSGSDVPNNAVQQVITAVRKTGLFIDQKDNFYWLDLTTEQVDATYFMTRAYKVEALAADPAEVDALLALWQADPAAVHKDYLAKDFWKRLDPAWRSVVNVIRDADTAFRDRLTNLAEFRELFPTHPWANYLRPRKRLLVVDDEHAQLIRDVLGPDYDYKTITDVREWWKLVNAGPLEFDGAIVDRCLSAGSSDQSGYDVLDYLCRNHEAIPRILISAQLGGAQRELIERYGLYEAFGKLNGDELTGLGRAVERMLSRPVQR